MNFMYNNSISIISLKLKQQLFFLILYTLPWISSLNYSIYVKWYNSNWMLCLITDECSNVTHLVTRMKNQIAADFWGAQLDDRLSSLGKLLGR